MVIEVGSRKIGAGQPCFVIAEAGVNHNGRLEIAHRLIEVAADAGADAVKFQTWITEKLCRPGAPKADYQRDNDMHPDQFEMLKRLELPWAWHAELRTHAEQRGILFLSTPDEIDSAQFLASLGVPAIKIGSAEVTNTPFLQALAQLGLPLLLSTGMSTLNDVRVALDAIRAANDVPVALLHCLSAYPAPEEEMNLRAIAAMRDAFGVPVGLSDHTTGSTAALLSLGLGSALLEKHITVDRSLEGPDHRASAGPDEFRELVAAIRHAEEMLGTGVKDVALSERNTLAAVRRTLCYARDLAAEHALETTDIIALRAGGNGMPPSALPQIIGRTLRRAVHEGDVVALSDYS